MRNPEEEEEGGGEETQPLVLLKLAVKWNIPMSH
jgi:hypothetical protein